MKIILTKLQRKSVSFRLFSFPVLVIFDTDLIVFTICILVFDFHNKPLPFSVCRSLNARGFLCMKSAWLCCVNLSCSKTLSCLRYLGCLLLSTGFLFWEITFKLWETIWAVFWFLIKSLWNNTLTSQLFTNIKTQLCNSSYECIDSTLLRVCSAEEKVEMW